MRNAPPEWRLVASDGVWRQLSPRLLQLFCVKAIWFCLPGETFCFVLCTAPWAADPFASQLSLTLLTKHYNHSSMQNCAVNYRQVRQISSIFSLGAAPHRAVFYYLLSRCPAARRQAVTGATPDAELCFLPFQGFLLCREGGCDWFLPLPREEEEKRSDRLCCLKC